MVVCLEKVSKQNVRPHHTLRGLALAAHGPFFTPSRKPFATIDTESCSLIELVS